MFTIIFNLPVIVRAADTNVALNKTATACQSNSGIEGPSNAVDGTNSNHWCSTDSGPHWLMVDLGATYNIGRYVVFHAQASGDLAAYNTKEFKFQVSSDGVNFLDVDTVTNNTASSTDKNISATGRYVRLYIITGA